MKFLNKVILKSFFIVFIVFITTSLTSSKKSRRSDKEKEFQKENEKLKRQINNLNEQLRVEAHKTEELTKKLKSK